jgi:hypothetical protein
MGQETEPPHERAQLGDANSEESVAFAVFAVTSLEEPLEDFGGAFVGERVQLTLDVC